jgi:hypothetical protein
MWTCGIGGCGRTFEGVEALLVHQVEDHERHECAVCGAVVPEGFFAIEHAFENHTRAEYVRAYDADSDDIRARESVKDTVEGAVDVAALKRRLGAEP